MKKKGKGNVQAQRKRKKERKKHLPMKQPEKVMLIDGNLSYYPVAFCTAHGGYLTQGLADTHRCIKRQCSGYSTELYENGGNS